MSLTGIAALIAALSFAVLACAGVYLAVRFTRVLDDAATLVRDTRSDQKALFARANTAVDRANAQLDLTEAVLEQRELTGDHVYNQARLVAEAAIDRGLADARRLGNRLNRHSREPVLG